MPQLSQCSSGSACRVDSAPSDSAHGWLVGDRFVCLRGRTWVVESVKRIGTHTLMVGGRCVLPSRECPEAIGQVANFDAKAVTKLESTR